MSMDKPSAPSKGEGLDADAVCAACGTVNPEGTFICRVCGNNLRDQRQRRLMAEQQLDGQDAPAADRSKLLQAGLSILGILIVLWVTLNVGNIENMLLTSQLDTSAGASHWQGSTAIIYNRMIEALLANPPSQAQIDAAQADPIPSGTPDGNYVLIWADGLRVGRTAGFASVETQGTTVYFVGQMENGVELRGSAESSGSAYMAVSETSAAFDGTNYVGITGVAAPQGDGSFEVAGFSDNSDIQYTVMAYRLP